MRQTRQIAFGLVILSAYLQACSWSFGYFHQVTALRGRVVGKDLGPLQFRWLRQLFPVGDATLVLREYGDHVGFQNLKIVGTVKTDSDGNFDFGTVSKGHYYLEVHSQGVDGIIDLYQIEVTDAVRPTKTITIDVSPFHPNCTGGHEFIEAKA